MTRAQGIASLATIGSLAALIALETGMPAARADELQDLIANQRLLEQRIDQLAKAQAGEQQAAITPGPVVSGAPSIAGSFPRSFLVPGTNTSLAITGYVKFDAAEFFRGGSTNVGSGVSPPVIGLSALAGAPLNLKGPPGTIFATPAFNGAQTAKQGFIYHDSAYQSRLRFETRTPSDYGQVGTVIEFDFGGCASNAGAFLCNSLDNGTFPQLPRLRLAYATLGGFLAGQAYIPVNDLDSGPELLDFSGDAGQFGFSRAPWIGYTWQLPYGSSFQLAAVTPRTALLGPLGAIEDDTQGPPFIAGSNDAPGAGLNPGIPQNIPGVESRPAEGYAANPTKTEIPDLNLVLRNNQPWGHVQLGLIAARYTLADGAFLNQNFLGYGGGISGNVKPAWFGWDKDNFGFNFFAGPGLGHYASPGPAGEPTTFGNALASNFGLAGTLCNSLTGVGCYGNTAGGGAARSAANASLVRTATILQYGAEANYQHWWTPDLRSTISGGFQTQDVPVNLVTANGPDVVFNTVPKNANALGYNKTLITAHVNLIWSPVSFIDTGLEFVWGHRLTILGATGSLDILDYAFKVKF